MVHIKKLAVPLSRQRWLPYKTRRSLLKRICPDMLESYEFEVEFFEPGSGLKFAGNIANYIDRLVYFCGAHEKYMLAFLRDYVARLRQQVQHPVAYVDVGANAGNHSVFMARLVDIIYAFEPFDLARKRLEHNLAINNIHNVTLFDFALSNENAVRPFYAAPASNLGAASFQDGHKQDNYYLGDLELKRGDEVMTEQGARIDIIKADVEGHEKFVMEGLRETLERDRPLIIIEVTRTTRDTLGSAEALQNLFPDAYDLFYFAKGSNHNGRYLLAPYDYALTPKIEDVIACPREKLMLLSLV